MTDKLLSDWPGVLAEGNVPHDSDLFAYCAERNAALWAFVRAVNPGASGNLNNHVDAALAKSQALEQRVEGLEARIRRLKGAILTARRKMEFREIDSAMEVLQNAYYDLAAEDEA